MSERDFNKDARDNQRKLRGVKQMTLEIGMLEDELSTTGSYSVSGRMPAIEELEKGDELTVTITNADGVVVAHAVGMIGFIGFKLHDVDGVRWTERQHRAKLITKK